ncbi:MAG: cytochrome c3 family protein, partial [Thermincolia bacterium]
NNTTGPWAQFATGGAVNNDTLGTWNTSGNPDGSYTVRLRVATGTESFINLYLDNTPPSITQGPDHAPMDNHATISWKTDEPSTTEVVYRVSPAGVWHTVTDLARVTNHVYKLTKLSANTTYEYKVRSVDVAGNLRESISRNFTTLQQGPYAEITSPAVIAQLPPTLGNTIQIRGSAYTTRTGGSVSWALHYGYGKTKEKVTTWNLITSSTTQVTNGLLANWTTPSPDGAYVLRLQVSDPGITGATATMEHYVNVVVDNSKAEITNFGVDNISNVSAVVYWETSKNTVDKVVYGFYPGVYPHVISDIDKDKKIFLYDLERNKTYYYKVRATDTAHRTVETPEQSFTTTNNITDVVPPVVSSVYLTAAARTNTTVDLKWNAATDNFGVAGYKIFHSTDGNNFTLRGAVPGTALVYQDTGLTANTDYWYYLKAFDVAGNESVSTGTIKKTTTINANHINPHGAYSKITVMCSKCHSTHMGKKEYLFNATQEANMCYICHDASGSGSKYAIQAEYQSNPLSRHPLPMGHTSKECASCHNPHLNPATYPKLLSAKTVSGTVYSSGNSFCYVCHGIGGPERVLDNTAGAHDDFENSVHNSVYFPAPVSGTGVKCALCHNNHASKDVRLTKAPEEENCYKCHGPTANQYNTRNIQIDLTKRSGHNVKGSPATGNVECVNCHNPHYIRKGLYNTSDPYNTISVWTGDRTTFCLRCHDNDAPPQRQVSRTVNIPYTVYFPPISLTTTYSVYGWNKIPYLNSVHYNNNPTRVQCNDCHTPHGSNSQRLLSRPEDQLGDDNQGLCGNCHSAGGRNSLYPKAKNIYSTMGSGTASFHPTYSINALDIHDDNEEIKNKARHAECWDCHESHTVNKSPNSNADVTRLLGTLPAPYNSNYRTIVKDQVYRLGYISGVWVDSWPSTVAGYDSTPASTLFRRVILNAADNSVDNDYEWQMCIKCHSKYAYDPVNNQAPFNNPSSNGYGAFKQTDVAREFNPTANMAGHSVIPRSDGTFRPMPMFRTAGGQWKYYGRYAGVDDSGRPWGGDSVLKCSDCHRSPSGVRGPHGSSNQFLLVAPWDPDTTGTAPPGDVSHLCFRCHDYTFYTGFNRSTGQQVELNNDDNFRTQFAETTGGRNLHTERDHSTGNEVNSSNVVVGPVSCGSCHGALPHGWFRTDGSSYSNTGVDNTQNRGLAITVIEDGPPYTDGVVNNITISTVPNTVGPERWAKRNCANWCNYGH